MRRWTKKRTRKTDADVNEETDWLMAESIQRKRTLRKKDLRKKDKTLASFYLSLLDICACVHSSQGEGCATRPLWHGGHCFCQQEHKASASVSQRKQSAGGMDMMTTRACVCCVCTTNATGHVQAIHTGYSNTVSK